MVVEARVCEDIQNNMIDIYTKGMIVPIDEPSIAEKREKYLSLEVDE